MRPKKQKRVPHDPLKRLDISTEKEDLYRSFK